MHESSTRFDTVSDGYVRFRPSYPTSLLQRLMPSPSEVRPSSGLWLDVGCGTGIFTRQFAEVLPRGIRVIGVEPSDAMREEARRGTTNSTIDYREGTAEALPCADGTVWAVTAATAAHWFDRPLFYAETVRVLQPGGFLAVLQYVRDLERSPAAAALDGYLNETGGPKAYRRPDYVSELEDVEGLRIADTWTTRETLHLDVEQYVGLALSSSHAAASVSKLGEDRVRADLESLARLHAKDEGLIPYGYRFELVIAYKAR